MEKEEKSIAIPIVLAVMVGLIFQASFAGVEGKDSPNKAVIEFIKAYYKIDPAMSERLCEEKSIIDDVDVVDEYIYRMSKKAKDLGHDISYMKSQLYEIDTFTLEKGDESARIRFTAHRRKAINPIYAIIAKLFFIGNTYEVDKTFNVVKEDGTWKVCEDILSL
jgi:hypothetical protein